MTALLVLDDELGALRKAEFAKKNKNSPSGQYGQVVGSGKRRDETRGALSRSHRKTTSKGGAAGFYMTYSASCFDGSL